MAVFARDALRWLRTQKEVTIRTAGHPDTEVVIWIVVAADDAVYVRSVKGEKGRWYRDLVSDGRATLDVMGQATAVRAIPGTDTASIEHASLEFLAKYRDSSYAAAMVRAEVLPTTLRLEPGEDGDSTA